MRLLDELRREGYRVDGAMFLAPDERPTVFYVAGHGMGTYVSKGDVDGLARMLVARRDRRRRVALAARLARALATRVPGDG